MYLPARAVPVPNITSRRQGEEEIKTAHRDCFFLFVSVAENGTHSSKSRGVTGSFFGWFCESALEKLISRLPKIGWSDILESREFIILTVSGGRYLYVLYVL